MDISLVILTSNQRGYTLRCLESVAALLDKPGREIILVDNGSADGTAEEVASRFPAVKIIRFKENMGVAAGRNAGLRAATGRHLMILDNDTIASCEVIESLSDYLDGHPETGLVAPRLVSPQGEVQTSFRAYPGIGEKFRNVLRGRRKSSVACTVPAAPIEPFYVIGAAQMFTAEVYKSSGGLDERIFFGPEDADFCMAVRAQGKNVVYNPALTIIHDWQRATTSRIFSKGARVHAAALLYFYRKHRRWF